MLGLKELLQFFKLFYFVSSLLKKISIAPNLLLSYNNTAMNNIDDMSDKFLKVELLVQRVGIFVILMDISKFNYNISTFSLTSVAQLVGASPCIPKG